MTVAQHNQQLDVERSGAVRKISLIHETQQQWKKEGVPYWVLLRLADEMARAFDLGHQFGRTSETCKHWNNLP